MCADSAPKGERVDIFNVPPHPNYFGSGIFVPKLTTCYVSVVSATDSLLARNRFPRWGEGTN
jgi:hypothetical protein